MSHPDVFRVGHLSLIWSFRLIESYVLRIVNNVVNNLTVLERFDFSQRMIEICCPATATPISENFDFDFVNFSCLTCEYCPTQSWSLPDQTHLLCPQCGLLEVKQLMMDTYSIKAVCVCMGGTTNEVFNCIVCMEQPVSFHCLYHTITDIVCGML